LYNMKSKLGETLDVSRIPAPLKCICTNSNGSLSALGFEDGTIKIYKESAGSLREMSQFEPFQRTSGDKIKGAPIVAMDVLEDYLIALSHDGVLSVVTRL